MRTMQSNPFSKFEDGTKLLNCLFIVSLRVKPCSYVVLVSRLVKRFSEELGQSHIGVRRVGTRPRSHHGPSHRIGGQCLEALLEHGHVRRKQRAR